MTFKDKLPDSVDQSVWYVAAAMVGAIFLGGVFLVYSIEVAVPGAASDASGAAASKEAAAKTATDAASTAGTTPAAGAPGPETKPATITKPATDTKPAADTKPAPAPAPAPGAAPVAGSASGTEAGPDPKAAAAEAPPSESARARIVADKNIRSAARSAGLLWAFACCAVGAFLGFIFGIPRSLSSDTARTTVAAQSRPSESASAKASTLAREKEEAAREVEKIGKEVDHAEAELTRLRTEAGAGVDSDPKVKAASNALAQARDSKRTADATLMEKTGAAQKAEILAKKDQGALSSAATPATGAGAEPVHTRAPSTAVNTNLEQISDWLTKIIVGVSLVNSDRIGLAMLRVAEEMAASFGGPGSRSLALAAMTYFGVIGLLGGYLLTRLFLQRAFEALASANQGG